MRRHVQPLAATLGHPRRCRRPNIAVLANRGTAMSEVELVKAAKLYAEGSVQLWTERTRNLASV